VLLTDLSFFRFYILLLSADKHTHTNTHTHTNEQFGFSFLAATPVQHAQCRPLNPYKHTHTSGAETLLTRDVRHQIISFGGTRGTRVERSRDAF
jgi:hypothetical protein